MYEKMDTKKIKTNKKKRKRKRKFEMIIYAYFTRLEE